MANKYIIKEVISKEEERLWLDLPSRLYKSDPNYIRPMDDEVKKVFDKKRNKLLRQGEAVRYLLSDGTKCIGRIAAFIDPKTSAKYEKEENGQPTGGCGFFDCIDDQEAANTLFDAAKKWLEERGMEAMDGPINFGDRDFFWGCLIEGFYEPVYNMPYNFPYYQKLFENYGFKVFFKQLTYRRELVPGNVDPIIYEKSDRVRNNPDYSFSIINTKEIDRYADDFLTIYNKAWAVIPGFARISHQHALSLLNSIKPILDPRLMHFAYYKGEPVAFFLTMIDMNQIYKGLNGKNHLLNKLRILWRVKVAKTCNRVISLAFGIVPEHRSRGLESALVCEFEKQASNKDFKYRDLQLNWIGDFNPSMMKLAESAGGTLYKTHATFRYLFDREKTFTRAKLQK